MTSTQRRGAEIFAFNLVERLRRSGHSAEVVALRDGGQGGLPLRVLGRGPRNPLTLWSLRRTARSADVVVAHGSATLPAGAIGLAGAKTPFVYRSIGDMRRWVTTPSRRLRTHLFLQRADHVVALWGEAAAWLAEEMSLSPTKLTVIPNGVPAGHFRPASSRERREARVRFGLPQLGPVAIVVGALSSEKDVYTAIDAVGILPDVHLLVAGDGPDRDQLESYAERKLGGRARFVGEIPDVRRVLWCGDVLLLTSLTEGLPAAPIEAAYCGIPSVATRVGALDEVIEDGVSGRLVPPEDPSAVALALGDVLADADRMGVAATERCERYEMTQVTKEWKDLLETYASR